jgi:hypothetical protein
MVLFDKGLEMGDIGAFFPSASLDVPSLPLDQIVFFAVLLLHIQNLFHLVVTVLLCFFLVVVIILHHPVSFPHGHDI